MVDRTLTRARLVAQGLVARSAEDPAELAARFLALQGQDLPGALSSLALRLPSGTDPMGRVRDAFARGDLVRGYPMRGTIFVMAAQDARWLTELCAPAQVRAAGTRHREMGIEQHHLERARSIVLEAADGPGGIGRTEVLALWEAHGIPVAVGAGYAILRHLIQTGVLVHGPLEGGENRIVLARRALPEGSGIAERFDGDEGAAVAELLLRYLSSRGPATVRDAGWFSKLPLSRLRAALPRIRDRLEEAGTDAAGEMRFQRPGLAAEIEEAGAAVDATFLLPGFDEMVLGYPDRLSLIADADHPRLVPGNNGMFQRGVVRRGTMIGLWRRAGRPGARRLETEEFASWPAIARRQVRGAFTRFPFPTA